MIEEIKEDNVSVKAVLTDCNYESLIRLIDEFKPHLKVCALRTRTWTHVLDLYNRSAVIGYKQSRTIRKKFQKLRHLVSHLEKNLELKQTMQNKETYFTLERLDQECKAFQMNLIKAHYTEQELMEQKINMINLKTAKKIRKRLGSGGSNDGGSSSSSDNSTLTTKKNKVAKSIKSQFGKSAKYKGSSKDSTPRSLDEPGFNGLSEEEIQEDREKNSDDHECHEVQSNSSHGGFEFSMDTSSVASGMSVKRGQDQGAKEKEEEDGGVVEAPPLDSMTVLPRTSYVNEQKRRHKSVGGSTTGSVSSSSVHSGASSAASPAHSAHSNMYSLGGSSLPPSDLLNSIAKMISQHYGPLAPSSTSSPAFNEVQGLYSATTPGSNTAYWQNNNNNNNNTEETRKVIRGIIREEMSQYREEMEQAVENKMRAQIEELKSWFLVASEMHGNEKAK